MTTPNVPLLAAAFALVTIGTAPAWADLLACNHKSVQVSIAIGYSDNDIWTSEGWWTIAAGNCATLVAGDLTKRYYYLRGTFEGGEMETGDFYFCTSPTVFTIVGDEDCEGRGFDRAAFSEVDTGDDKSHTVNLND